VGGGKTANEGQLQKGEKRPRKPSTRSWSAWRAGANGLQKGKMSLEKKRRRQIHPISGDNPAFPCKKSSFKGGKPKRKKGALTTKERGLRHLIRSGIGALKEKRPSIWNSRERLKMKVSKKGGN